MGLTWECVWVNPGLRMGMNLTHLPMTLHGLWRTRAAGATDTTVPVLLLAQRRDTH